MTKTVGILGLGTMGSAFAKNIVNAGFDLYGTDLLPDRLAAFKAIGGKGCQSAKEVAGKCEVMITSLPSVEAFQSVMTGVDSIRDSAKAGLIVIDTSTLPVTEKQTACDALAEAGVTLLDCPVSGTGLQAIDKNLSVFVSGDQQRWKDCIDVFDAFARSHIYVGEFGSGSKLNFVASHLVQTQNLAIAEAMVLGMKAGLDPEIVYSVVNAGAGRSRTFELRAGMMVEDDYRDATMRMELWEKDMKIISDFAAELHCPTPLFSAGTDLYKAALENGQHELDTASVCRVLEKMADLKRHKPTA